MSRWFRHYAGMMRDEKLVRVAVRTKQPIERVIWVWCAILESASEVNDGGRYDFDSGEAAYFLRADDSDIAAIQSALVSLGHLAGGYVVKWSDRQFESDTSKERQKRYRDRLKERSDVTVTSHDAGVTVQEYIDIEHIDTSEDKSSSVFVGSIEPTPDQAKASDNQGVKPKKARNSYPADFVAFWDAYPKTPIMSKKEAFGVWQKLPTDDRDKAAAALPLFVQYCRENPDYPVVHACRFLSKRRADGLLEAAQPKATSPPPPVSPDRQKFLDEMKAKWGEASDELPAETETAAGTGSAGIHRAVRELSPGGSGLHPISEDIRRRPLPRDPARNAGMEVVGNLLPPEIWPDSLGTESRH